VHVKSDNAETAGLQPPFADLPKGLGAGCSDRDCNHVSLLFFVF